MTEDKKNDERHFETIVFRQDFRAGEVESICRQCFYKEGRLHYLRLVFQMRQRQAKDQCRRA